MRVLKSGGVIHEVRNKVGAGGDSRPLTERVLKSGGVIHEDRNKAGCWRGIKATYQESAEEWRSDPGGQE